MSREIWRDVFDAIEDPAFLHDSQFRVLRANRAYCRAAGVTEAQALGKPYWEVFPPGTGPLPGCKEVSVGAKLFLSKGYPIRDDQGKYLYSLHLLSDISAQRQATAALTESEERFRRATETARDAIIILDGESGAVIAWNPAAAAMFGYSEQEAIGRVLHDFLAPARFRALATKAVAHFASTGAGAAIDQTLEMVALHKNGTEFPIELSLSAAQIHGKWHATGIARDISERKRAEAALRENQVRLVLVLRSASMGVWHLDIIENRRYFDDQVCRLLGIDPATFTGAAEEFFGAVHPDDRETIKAALARTMEQDIPYEPEYRAVWPDGSIHYLTARGRLVRDDKGRPARLNGVIWDISERKLAQEALERKERYYRKMIEGGTDVFFLIDRAGTLLYRNESGKQLTGWETAELLGKPVTDFVSAESLPLLRNAMADSFAKPDQLIRVEVTMLRKDGTQVEIEALVKNLLDDPDVAGIVITVRDITERKQAEAKLAEQFNELQRWNEAMSGREMRILDLKHEVNELLGQAGLPLRYPSAESDAQKEGKS